MACVILGLDCPAVTTNSKGGTNCLPKPSQPPSLVSEDADMAAMSSKHTQHRLPGDYDLPVKQQTDRLHAPAGHLGVEGGLFNIMQVSEG
jgi:hypothetical protein